MRPDVGIEIDALGDRALGRVQEFVSPLLAIAKHESFRKPAFRNKPERTKASAATGVTAERGG